MHPLDHRGARQHHFQVFRDKEEARQPMPAWTESRPLPREAAVAAALVATALVAWIVTYQRMHGMDAGPGTDLGGLGWYVGVWVTMMAAMMLPSVAPMVLTFARVSEARASRGQAGAIPTWIFVAGYLISWTVYGLLAFGVYRLAKDVAPHFLAWNHAGRYVAGGALALAGVYELTPLKQVCLRHCRGPIHFVLGGWREGTGGALRMGGEHGAYCIGCCWGLMLALFALGVMSLTWMAAIAVLIFAQKVLPAGQRLASVFAVAFVAVGIWVAVSPASVPGLHVPGDGSATKMGKIR
jgi:predicted metal-binding membrane protein